MASIGKRKVGGGGPARGGGSMGKLPVTRVSGASDAASKSAKKAALRAKLAQKKGTDMGKSRPAPKSAEKEPPFGFTGGEYMFYLRSKKGRPAWPPGQ